jgi:MerR family transcriptional regulator, light-induced transcriptional regulator
MLITSAEAARLLRVGVSSVKRWTDEGELDSVRTPGGHRRYTPAALRQFASLRGLATDHLPPAPDADLPTPADVTLFEALASGDEVSVRRLVVPNAHSLAKRAAFLDRVIGEALREIGYRWERARLTVDQEHRASHMIAEAIDGLRPQPGRGSRLALLACPPGEHHELPLRLVRLILEWKGWQTHLLGSSLPWQSVASAIVESRPAIVAFSSRSGDPFRFRDFERLVAFCKTKGVQVLVGGEWARGGTGEVEGYLRFRTLRGFERWLRTFPHD